ncbi:MAG: DUF4230 domain-containing protein [Prevotella sp.]|nr:DUF4230 domain-containing protein [Prevotella sp.]
MSRRRNNTSKIGDSAKLLKQIVTLAIIIIAVVWYYKSQNDTVEVEVEQTIDLTPEQITSLKDIGQWEFLSIADEEMVDTVRKSLIFSDDQLVRIYYGTLRLGIDMSKVQDGWIKKQGDTVRVNLPPIELLDKDFIDEARTHSFYESGKWNGRDLSALYKRAYNNMMRRCLTRENIQSAEDNAISQFNMILKTMGHDNVIIRINKTI